MSDGIPRGLRRAVRVEYVVEVVRVNDPERSNRGEPFALRTVQFVRSSSIAHHLTVWSSRKIELPAEDVPSAILADVISVAPAA